MKYRITLRSIVIMGMMMMCASLVLASDTLFFQGVLRDGDGIPLPSGSYNMRFRVYNIASGGSSLWEETHIAAYAVTVTQGYYSVVLGDTNPFSVDFFSSYPDLWIETEVDTNNNSTFEASEIFEPRQKISSAAFAFQAKRAGGITAPVELSAAAAHPNAVLSVTNTGNGYAGYFTGKTAVEGNLTVKGNNTKVKLNTTGSITGIDIQQNSVNKWSNAWNSGSQYLYWYDYNGTPGTRMVIQDGTGNVGIGTATPGSRLDVDGVVRIRKDTFPAAGTGEGLELAYNSASHRGTVQSYDRNGGVFGTLYLGDGNVGIGTPAPTSKLEVHGPNFSIAKLGVGDYAVYGEGSKGGYFKSKIFSGEASLATGHYGLSAQGDTAGGYFKDSNGTGEAWVAYTDGEGREKGIMAKGAKVGGHFLHSDEKAEARCGYKDADGKEWGIWAQGTEAGGYFKDRDGNCEAKLGLDGIGVRGDGLMAGGFFDDTDSSGYARVGYSTHKIYGTGDCSFVQNHPYEEDKVIVYAAPEGDEVATYTRGVGRLVNGEATLQLGETFKWVTNPDIGLTAHVTPRGNCNGLYVASVSTQEIVVKELQNGKSDIMFDYTVYGLRIGFEEVSVVKEKDMEAYIPSMKDHRDLYTKRPELRKYNALERFKEMRTGAGMTKEVHLAASRALRDAIQEFDPAVHELPLP